MLISGFSYKLLQIQIHFPKQGVFFIKLKQLKMQYPITFIMYIVSRKKWILHLKAKRSDTYGNVPFMQFIKNSRNKLSKM